MTNFGDRVRARRNELGLTFSEIAEAANLSPSQLSGYIHGRREPNLRALIRLSAILQTSVDDLVGATARRSDLIREATVQLLQLEGIRRERAEALAGAILAILRSLPADPEAAGDVNTQVAAAARAIWTTLPKTTHPQ